MAQTDIFFAMSRDGLQIGGDHPGKYGSTDVRCPGAIEVLSYSHSVQQVGSESGGRPRSVESVVHGEFKIVKAVDATSPLFFRMCSGAMYIAEAKVLLYSAGGGWSKSDAGAVTCPQPFLIYTMSFVHINSVSPSGGSGIPTEEIGLKYGDMKVEHVGTNIARSWSQVLEAPVKFPGGFTTAGDQVSEYTPS